MSASTDIGGPRLEFVLRALPGTVTRPIASFDKTENVIAFTEAVMPAGYMLYLPDGHSYRLSAEEAKRRGYIREPNILNVERATDNKTAAGRFRNAVSEAARKKAYAEMEQEIVSVCEKFAGNVTNYITGYDPKGKVLENGRDAA